MTTRYLSAEIPLGLKGLNGSKNQSQIPIDALVTANSVTFESGTIQKEGGTTVYTTSGVGSDVATPSDVSVIAGHAWNQAASTHREVLLPSDRSLLTDVGAGAFTTTLSSGLTVSGEFPTFAEGGKEAAAVNRKLFIFTGLNVVKVLSANGSTASDIGTPPADWSGTNQLPHAAGSLRACAAQLMRKPLLRRSGKAPAREGLELNSDSSQTTHTAYTKSNQVRTERRIHNIQN